MTLDQLRIFVAVAEHGHVTRAARAVGITQSAASAAISALESRYGTRLFDRVGRGIEISDVGRRFLPEAKALLDRAAAAQSVLEDSSGLVAGSIAIIASQTIFSYWLPRRLSAFHAAHPGVGLDVSVGNTRQVEEAVVQGAADVGFAEGPTRHLALIREAVDVDRLVLVMAAGATRPDGHDLADFDLRSVPWVIREAGSGTRAALEALALSKGLTLDDLNVFLVLPDNEAIRSAVAAGAGATIISEHVVARDIEAGLLRALPIGLPERAFVLLRHRDRHPSAAVEALRASILGRQQPTAAAWSDFAIR